MRIKYNFCKLDFIVLGTQLCLETKFSKYSTKKFKTWLRTFLWFFRVSQSKFEVNHHGKIFFDQKLSAITAW